MNRLAAEPSRYLHQHAEQPVDWWPWGPGALAEARRRQVPLFVSVGYSACHWCHVMAHESFDDPELAAVLNAGFVPVKVDREERPDIDAVYMEALLTTEGHGGWPMSVFCTPDGRPFFCGTYFPRRDRAGMPGFDRVLAAVLDAWEHRRAEVERQADALAAAVARRTADPVDDAGAGDPTTADGDGPVDDAGTDGPTTANGDSGHHGPAGDARGAATGGRGAVRIPSMPAARHLARAPEALDRGARELVARLDAAHGGFGPAPKFPQPALLELLLVHHSLGGDPGSLQAATVTLGAMAAGGIYDHLAGGFARYATDVTWTVPHFEKMLYDQAGLVRAYLHAWQVTGDRAWRQVVDETVGFVLEELALPDGGLAAALDADSEGEEGRYYVWTTQELRHVLGDHHDAVASWYQVDGQPAFEGRHVLRRPVGATLIRPPEVEVGRQQLLRARQGRVRPGRDDKVIAEWNGMFVSALAEAAAATGRQDWAAAAERTGSFLWAALRQPGTGRPMRTWQEGAARHDACAADVAWLTDACTRLAELTGEGRWLERAVALADDLLARFAVPSGLLAMTADDAEPLLARPVDVLDGATPSASAVAAAALVRLGALAARPSLVEAGHRLAAALATVAIRHPVAVAHGVTAATLAAGGTTEVVVTARREEMMAAVRRRFDPAVVLVWGERWAAPLWAGRPDDGRAYVCAGTSCLPPADSPQELDERLRQRHAMVAAALAVQGRELPTHESARR